MKSIIRHLKKYILRGMIALIPITLSVLAVRFIYITIDERITSLLDRWIGFQFPGLGVIIVLIIIYFVGLIASNMVGRQIFKFIERISNRIPLVKTTYAIGKQLETTLSLPEKQVFKRAVLVEYIKPGMWTVGFVTGSVVDKVDVNEKILRVFIPTAPNPTTGMMLLVRESQVRDPGWSVKEALNLMISGGILGPNEIKKQSS